MKILATSCAHDSSACYLEDGVIKYWNKQERLSRVKRQNKPYAVVREIEERFDLSDLDYYITAMPFQMLSEADLDNPYLYNWQAAANPLNDYIQSFYPKAERVAVNTHHLTHAASAFYSSGFDSAYVLVVDRNGSVFIDRNNKAAVGVETETLVYCEYPATFKPVWRNPGHWVGVTGLYSLVSEQIGIGQMENGKTMGLSTYGKPIPGFSFYDGYKPNIPNNVGGVKDPKTLLGIISDAGFRQQAFTGWFPKGVKDEDLAHQVQAESTQAILKLIDEHVDASKCKNLCFTGGHAHNCLLNYEIANTFPDLELFVDPIPDDAGTSIGAAKFWWYTKTQSKEKFPLQDIYQCG